MTDLQEDPAADAQPGCDPVNTAQPTKSLRIEALLVFPERTSHLAASEQVHAFARFSRELSAAIYGRRAKWRSIAPELLRAKITGEARVAPAPGTH
ncbi:MAG TPA: hypothetical protein VF203_08095 [Burkholderiales bacterium]